jgi:lipopolysaccharide/colanic/teichoic acid biosynthesis glycosyltransferase
LTGSIALLPIFVVISVGILVDSGWPALFAQRRVGREEKSFRMWKFRTMTKGAEALPWPLLPPNEAPPPAFKLRHDPRVTRFGRLLRRSGLDELPQLWNVLRGDMSLVGPRPALPTEVERYDALARGRLAARPGLTCTWQVARRYRSDITFEEWMRMDLAYIEQWSLGLDLRLILSAIPALARLSGE